MTRRMGSPKGLGKWRNAVAAAVCFGAALVIWLWTGLPDADAFEHVPPPADLESLPLETLAGEPFELTARPGRVTVINFWATWCLPCRAEMRELDALWRAHGDSLHVIGINFGESRREALGYANNLNLGYTLLLDATGEAATRFGVRQLPTTFLLDDRLSLKRAYYGPLSVDRLLRDMAALSRRS